jgi:hypothetical protein
MSLTLTKSKPPIPIANPSANYAKQSSNNRKLLVNQQQSQTSNAVLPTKTTLNTRTMKSTIGLEAPIASANSQETGVSPRQDVINKNNKALISPSGLLTDGPLNRKSSVSPSRLDRSKSPVDRRTNLQTIQESRTSNLTNIRAQTPLSAQKITRKSLLPQPNNLSNALRKPSVSPMR